MLLKVLSSVIAFTKAMPAYSKNDCVWLAIHSSTVPESFQLASL